MRKNKNVGVRDFFKKYFLHESSPISCFSFIAVKLDFLIVILSPLKSEVRLTYKIWPISRI